MLERPLCVKVCGITSLADAILCAEVGVDLIGLNFVPESKRSLALEPAAEIVSAVRAQFPAMKFVGVFVNEDLAVLRGIARALALAAIQLHGEESPAYARYLRDDAFVIKAFRINSESAIATAVNYPCDAVLLDGWNPDHRGGTGETFDWTLAASLRPRIPRLILAGGLHAGNVAHAIRTVHPSAVDVCSGVEDSPGRKNPNRLRRFLEEVGNIKLQAAALLP